MAMDDQSKRVGRCSDDDDILLAHKYRLSLSESPSQSSFRVLALLFYQTEPDDCASALSSTGHGQGLPPFIPLSRTTEDGRNYVVGTNDEPGYMGGAICAERAAMVQLRFAPPYRLTKVVIATDSEDPIAPGMLCREFLAGHRQVPWNLPVVSAGSRCLRCKRCDDALFLTCTDKVAHHNHDIQVLRTTLEKLYPFPSPYTRLSAQESVSVGERFRCSYENDTQDLDLDETAKNLLAIAINEARSTLDKADSHPIQFGAAVAFADGSIVTSHQSSGLEYGCTLDAVSQLASHIIKNPGGRPILLVQTDQFGICHAPFAPARSFLTEHGYGDCQILLHDASKCAKELSSSLGKWTLKRVEAAQLAPNPPSWTQSSSVSDSREPPPGAR
jgi:cytidine deaminase